MTVTQLPVQPKAQTNTLAGAAAGSTLPPQQVARIQRSAKEFEAMALGQILAPMFQTVDSSKGAFGGGSGEQAWQPMMVTELGKSMAKAGGVGLARPIMDQMLRMQESRADGSSGDNAARNPTEQTPVEQMLLERPALRRTTSQQMPLKPGV